MPGRGMSGWSDIEGELDFGVAASSFPTSFKSTGCRTGGMEQRQRMLGSVEGGGKVRSGKIAQMEEDLCGLDCWRLRCDRRFGRFLAGLVQRWGCGDGGGLQIFSSRRREVLLGREPMIPFRIAGEAAPEDPALHPGQFEFLIADGVVGGERRSGERNAIILPSEIAKSEQSIGSKLVERPATASLQFEETGAEIAVAGDKGSFGEIELGIVGGLEMGMAEVRDLPAGREMRVSGVPLERGKDGRAGGEAEFGGSHPGKRAAIQELAFDHAEQEAAIVLAVEKGIVHVERNVAGGEVEGNGLIVPIDTTLAEFEAIDGQREEGLDHVLAAKSAGLALRKVGGAVGIKGDGRTLRPGLRIGFGGGVLVVVDVGARLSVGVGGGLLVV